MHKPVEKDAARLRLAPGEFAPRRILICRPNVRLGNTLLLTPLLQETEVMFPGAEVDIVTACEAAPEIFRGFGCVRTIHQLPRHGAFHPTAWLGIFLRARRKLYDLVIDPCPKSWSSRFWTRAMSTPCTIGFTSPSKAHGSSMIGIAVRDAPCHMGKYPVYLLRRALGGGAHAIETATPPLDIFLTDAERSFGRHKLRQLCRTLHGNGPIVAVFASATGIKRLPVSWWDAALAHIKVQVPGVRIVEIVAASGEMLLRTPAAYYSTSIRRLAAVIDAADCFLSADNGVMHLAAATSTPTIGLFTVTDPAVYAPYGRWNTGIRIELGAPEQAARRIVRHLGQCAEPRLAPLEQDLFGFFVRS